MVVKKGHMKLSVHRVDTDVDVVVIATLNNIKLDELRVSFGVDVHFLLQST